MITPLPLLPATVPNAAAGTPRRAAPERPFPVRTARTVAP
jgi:hypothetical protein